jgi:putative transcriptional regulator
MKASISKRDLKLIERDAQALKDWEDGKTKEPKGFVTVRILLPPKPAEIKGLRRKLHLTQDGLARLLNTGVYAVRSWEQGQRTPDGPVSLLMRLILADPAVKKAAYRMQIKGLKDPSLRTA